ncbi:MAG: N-6 DNA methylase [Candidatus Pacebacteria bacterium]|nr:N-6 DNA methylase [Candidatus Paceibacterota bacterium]
MNNYFPEIQKYFSDHNSSEHSYRTTFENYLKEVFPMKDGYFTQQDQRAINGNKPDFVILKNNIPILYIEVKKVGEDLDKIEKSNQADRYFGYDNLIISDYVDFRFFRNGEKSEAVMLAEINKKDRTLTSVKDISVLAKIITDFVRDHKEPIKRGKHLAQIMGGKAKRIRDNVRDMLVSNGERYTELLNIKKVVTENLVSSLKDEDFADMYAQTLVYGLFAARYNDKTNETFSRAEARDLVPKTNPFLHSFFDHIAGASFPDRLRFIVDELCEVFSHADVQKILYDFYGKEKDNKDPIIHFYEDFLKEYDSKKKMDMGVFYTPRPVVQFIVRSVDEILKKEFGIVKGLADTEKVKIKFKEIYQAQKRTKAEEKKDGSLVEVEKEYHRVQVLDVATGTGTFLNEVIAHIHKGFVGQEGRWESYVKENLLPRLHGFELMMASYTIAHLKLGMTLADSGVSNLNQRLGVYLTNTLDEPKDYSNQGSLFGFMDAIAEESKNASRVKSEYPIMCVIGNPPYSGISQNKDYKDNSVYKVEPGGKSKLQERKHWLDDDYVKFIRFAESLIEKNGEGVVGMITAHGYIDNPTFRGMRWHLRNTFDTIYVVDLHGNSNKKETTPDSGKDENVFDIKTGVSILFGVKKRNVENKSLADVYKLDLYGLREEKFEVLEKVSFESVKWQKLPTETELWVLEGRGKSEYMEGFSVAGVFPKNTTGIVTGIDRLSIFETKEELEKTTRAILNSNDPYTEFGIKDGRRTKKEARVAELREAFENNTLTSISYRPFDTRYMYYTIGSEVWINSPRPDVMQHFVNRENIAILISRQGVAANPDFYDTISISSNIVEFNYYRRGGEFVCPFYLYTDQNEKIPNLDKEIWNKINQVVGETTPENILDYIYAVLHSPTYREKYKEFLKIDFPRVPYPVSKDNFWKLSKLGEKLRGLHLMTDPEVNDFITTFQESGTDEVEKISYKDEKVYINANQYFGNVPEIAWNFYIGGYQPAQKYLKDRKGRKLSNEEIEHYQKIIKVLSETDKLMKEIDII